MDRRIRFYSDDSYSSCGQRRHHVVVAGFALEYDRANVREALIESEYVSGKGRADWFRTPGRARERYLELVLGISSIRGRIFYYPFDRISMKEIWGARLDALSAAINTFTTRDCQHLMAPEGLQGKPRHELRIALLSAGHQRVLVESAVHKNDPEVRLADAIAGYIRSELYRGDGERAILTNLPDHFVKLEP